MRRRITTLLAVGAIAAAGLTPSAVAAPPSAAPSATSELQAVKYGTPASENAAVRRAAAEPGTRQLVMPQTKRQARMAAKLNPFAQDARALKALKAAKEVRTPGHSLATRPAKAIKRIAPKASNSLPQLRGYVIYADSWANLGDDETAPYGIYDIPTVAGNNLSLFAAIDGGYNDESAIAVGQTYYIDQYVDYYGFIQFGNGTAYDIQDFAPDADKGFAYEDLSYNFLSAATNSQGVTYGLFKTADGSSAEFCSVDFSTAANGNAPARTVIDAEPAEMFYGMAFDGDDVLYGINDTGDLYTINVETGVATLVGASGVETEYMSSMCYDAKSDALYYATCTDTGDLYKINKATAEAAHLSQFADAEEVIGLYVAAAGADDDAPAAPTDLAVDAPLGALSGNVTFTAPAGLVDGTAGSGTLTYSVAIGANTPITGSCAYGEAVSVPFTVTVAGYYRVSVLCDNGKPGVTAKLDTFIGKAIAKAPENVALNYAGGQMSLSWEPVTEGETDGYFDPAAVTYKVTRADGSIAAENIADCSFAEAVAEPEALTAYQYAVQAVYDGEEGEAALSNAVTLGSIIPPYSCSFATAADFAPYTVINANGDSSNGAEYTFSWSQGQVACPYNSAEAMDDWLITPPVKLQGGKMYECSIDVKARSTSLPERVEVKMGNAPTAAAMTEVLVKPTDVDWTDFTPVSFRVVAPDDGTYYIGFHGISDPDMYYLTMTNVVIGEAQDAPALPNAPANFAVTPDPNGELKAIVSFDTPSNNLDGSTIAAITSATIKVDGEVVKVIENPAVGAALSEEIPVSAFGTYSFSAFVTTADGDGEEASAKAYVGKDIPNPCTNITMVESASTPGEVTIAWTAPATDINGVPLTEADLTYAVYAADGYSRSLVQDGLTATTYTFQAVPEGEQDFVQYLIFAYDEAGESDGDYTPFFAAGTPYVMPFAESFANGTLSSIWGTSGSLSFALGSSATGIDPQDADGGFLYGQGKYVGDKGQIYSGKIAVDANADTPELSFFTFQPTLQSGEASQNTIAVLIGGTEVAKTDPATMEADKWQKVTVDLSAYKGQVISVTFEMEVVNAGLTLIDNIQVKQPQANDLKAAAIIAPARAPQYATFNVDVKVLNAGNNNVAAADYKVVLKADGQQVAEQEGKDLAPDAIATFSFAQKFGAMDKAPRSYSAEIVFAADNEPSNNATQSVAVDMKAASLPAVQNLTATVNGTDVVLAWDAPNTDASVEQKEEGFEGAAVGAAAPEGWLFIDNDGKVQGGFSDLDIPGITAGSTTGSFVVVNQSIGNSYFAANSGEQYIMAVFNAQGDPNDDWAISPSLSGNAQTISFYAKSYSATYPESFKVMYTLGSDPTALASYVEATEANGQATSGIAATWTQYSYALPQGANYFALVYCSADCFAMMADDFSFEAGSNVNLELEGYNVYRDGAQLNQSLVAQPTFVDGDSDRTADHDYAVTASYAGVGEGAPSNIVTVQSGIDNIAAQGIAIKAVNGNIVVAGAQGKAVAIYAPDGKALYSTTAAPARLAVPAASGVYMVRAAGTVAKVALK